MTDIRRPSAGGPHGASAPDPAVTAALRQHYAAPADAAYWDALEGRIARRLALDVAPLRPRWWTGFAALQRRDLASFGMAAATLALLLAGAAVMRQQQRAQELAALREQAARAAVEATLPLPLDDATLTRARVHLAPDAPERYLNPLDY